MARWEHATLESRDAEIALWKARYEEMQTEANVQQLHAEGAFALAAESERMASRWKLIAQPALRAARGAVANGD